MSAHLVALDFGLSAGWAVFEIGSQRVVGSGAWDLKQAKAAHPGAVWSDYRRRLAALLDDAGLDVALVAYERATIYGHWNASRMLFGQATITEAEIEARGVPGLVVSPTSYKKHVAGSGRADKARVILAVERRTGPLSIVAGEGRGRVARHKARTDEADARAVGLFALDRAATEGAGT